MDKSLYRLINGWKRRKFVYLLMVSGIFLITLAVALGIQIFKLEKRDSAWLPETLASLRLEQQLQGNEAVSEINQLHGKSFALVDGAVGRYGAGQVTLWVSQAISTSSAEEILLAMRDSIAVGDSPFIPLRESKHANRIVYEVEGLGQLHYYFQSSDLVVWVAADTTNSDAALADALVYFP